MERKKLWKTTSQTTHTRESSKQKWQKEKQSQQIKVPR